MKRGWAVPRHCRSVRYLLLMLVNAQGFQHVSSHASNQSLIKFKTSHLYWHKAGIKTPENILRPGDNSKKKHQPRRH